MLVGIVGWLSDEVDCARDDLIVRVARVILLHDDSEGIVKSDVRMSLVLKSLFKTARCLYRLVNSPIDKKFSDNSQPADGNAGRSW